MTLKYLTAAALTFAAAGAVQAEGWTVTDFDSLPNRATCMSYAETTIDTFRLRHGTDGFTGRSDWTIGGYDLLGDPIDALFVCADEGAVVEPMLVVYNTDDDSDRRINAADQLGDIWDEIVANGGFPNSGGGTLTPIQGATK